MALFRRFFHRKPLDRLLEISERVYVFDCCFSTDVLEEEEYKVYLGGIVAQLQDYFPDASFMVFNFREGERRSQISEILSEYDITVMDYPRQYEGCPMLPLEMIHHFLRSSESWLSLEGQPNVLLMHCERGGWPVLAFMLAGLLLYRKQYNGEHKTLEMVYKQAPRELLHLLCQLNPQPSHLRYLHYISQRNFGSDWPPSDAPLLLDCLMLKALRLFEGGKGCRPVIRVYGQDPSKQANRTSKLLFSTSKAKRHVHHYIQEECMLVKIDIQCRIQGDVVFECIHFDEDLVHEELMFRVMFHTAFVQANILMLNRNEIDILWDAKDRFPKDFRAEVLFVDADVVVPNLSIVKTIEDENEIEIASPEEFFEVEEIFSSVVDAKEAKGDYHTRVVHENKPIDHKEVWKKDEDPLSFQDCTYDDVNHNQGGKVDSNFVAVNDIGVDDVKYKVYEKGDSDLEAVKDIAVDDGDIKLDYVVVGADVLVNNETKEVTVDLSEEFKEMEDKADREYPATRKKLECKVPPVKVTADVDRQKAEKVVLHSRKHPLSNTKPAADLDVGEKTKEHEPHGTIGKQARPITVPWWVPPNKSPYTNSFHVAYPPSRHNSVPSALGITSPNDSNASAIIKSSVTAATGHSISSDFNSSLVVSTPPLGLQEVVLPPPQRHSNFLPGSFGEAAAPSPYFSPIINVLSTSVPPVPQSPPPPSSMSSVRQNIEIVSHHASSITPPPPPPLPPSTGQHIGMVLPPPPTPPSWKSGYTSAAPATTSSSTPPPAIAAAAVGPPPPSPLIHVNEPNTAHIGGVGIPIPPSPPSTRVAPLTQSPVPPPLRPVPEPICRTHLTPLPPPPPPTCGILPLRPLPTIHIPSHHPPVFGAPPQPPLSGCEAPPLQPAHGTLPPPPPPPLHGTTTPPLSSPISEAPPPPPQGRPLGRGPPPALGGGLPLPPPLGARSSGPPTHPRPPCGVPLPSPPISAKGAAADTRGAGRGRGLLHPSRMGPTTTVPRRSSLKPLHWSKVTRALQGSLWEELQRHGEPQIAPEFDVSELESLFSATVSKTAGLGGKGGARHKSSGSKTEKVQLIDLRRANNTEIMLTKVKMPLSDITAAVLAMDESVLDVDQVENLIKFCPTKEEMELLKGYTGDNENLGKCEQYFLELMKVPRVESKLRVFSFKIQFGSQILEFKKSLHTVNSACDEVRDSLKLKEIMKKILCLGNTLNQGTARGSAIGFRLDGLSKLIDTRASNSKMTLMHYLCKVLAAKSPALLDFHQDLVSLEAASKIQLKSLAEEMQAIIKGLEKVEHELESSENDGPISEVFHKTLKDFISVAEIEVASVTSLYSVAGRNADALALYFGEDPAHCPFEQVTATLLNFVRSFRKANEENLKQAELEKKKVDKEAEMEKAKEIDLTKKRVK